jgi:REP element-mobilizing transposase RayT
MARAISKPKRGRPRSGFCKDAPHRQRPELSKQHPVHVVLRTVKRFTELRQRTVYKVIHRVLRRYLGDKAFRVVHVSIQNTHLHLLVEASNREALTRGMQSFAINAARALNGLHGACGKVFQHRYHATQIKTARQARNSLSYVLNNWRRHREDFENGRFLTHPVDAYSSGVTFTGWSKRPRFALPADYSPLPTSPPQTDLLASGYLQYGRVDYEETPGKPWF